MVKNASGQPSRRTLLRVTFHVGVTAIVALPVMSAAAILPDPDSPSVASTESAGGFAGTAIDLATDRPVRGATITAYPGGYVASTNDDGRYALSLPSGQYHLKIRAHGFIDLTYLAIAAGPGLSQLDIGLAPESPTPDQQQLLYQRLVKQSVSPLVDVETAARVHAFALASALPTVIQVNYGTATSPNLTAVALEDYVKGVVPNEVPYTWPSSALQAQAVASRSYGVASQLATGWVYPDSRSQVYNPSFRTATTDAAADATVGVVMTYSGAVIFAYFFAQCNGTTTHNSESATTWLTDSSGNYLTNSLGQYECSLAGWGYVAYCRARPCTGHTPYSQSDCGYNGDGVGLCQWGAYYRSLNDESYQSILGDYYTGIAYMTIPVNGPTPTPLPTPTPTLTPIPTPRPLGPWLVVANQPFTLSWTSVGPGVYYLVTLYPQGGGVPLNQVFTQSLSWSPSNGLALGTYTWTILAYNSSTQVTATLDVVNHVYTSYLPVVGD
jgi:hypothetical protein